MSKGYGKKYFYRQGEEAAGSHKDAEIFRAHARLMSKRTLPIWAREAFYRGYFGLWVI